MPGSQDAHATLVPDPSRMDPAAGGRASPVTPTRVDGYAPLADYAVIGDGRTVALVARDGSIDWWCLPNVDSPSVLGAVLDARRGGRFALAPVDPYSISRRYAPNSNVLETTFATATGRVCIRDALTLPLTDVLAPFRELTRSIVGLEGTVRLRWHIEPRFGYSSSRTVFETRRGVPVATSGGDALAICTWDAGRPIWFSNGLGGELDIAEGRHALIALSAAHQEPLVFPSRAQVLDRLARTDAFWRAWADARSYSGRWREPVLRSALVLKLLVFAPSGALVAAPTTSLPEQLGGVRNWDYRYCWIRDSVYALEALLRLGCHEEAHAFFWWFMHATRLTLPRLRTIYRIDGGAHLPERELPLEGYRGSRPVRTGNQAADQRQLDIYGELLATAWLYASQGYGIDPDTGAELGEIADFVMRTWQQPDRGIWEVRSDPRHFTHSKFMCWVGLDRARRLAELGCVPAARAPVWTAAAAEIRSFIERHCWSDRLRSYVQFAGSEELDASLLMMPVLGYDGPPSRLLGTVDAVSRLLGHGPFVYRYRGEDGLGGHEGAFLPCSFWLVQALATCGRHADAARLMDDLCRFANDTGLYSEEIDPRTGEFLGNFPQGLVHLALVNAALALAEGTR